MRTKKIKIPIRYYCIRFFYRIEKLFQFLKWGWSDCDWDFAFLLELEQKKIKTMADTFEKANFFEGCEFVVRDMRICVSLLDIVMEKSHCYNLLHEKNLIQKSNNKKSFHYNANDFKYVRTHNVNSKNAERFMDDETIELYFGKDASDTVRILGEDDLRQLKAWRLYCKIRAEHLREWWY